MISRILVADEDPGPHPPDGPARLNDCQLGGSESRIACPQIAVTRRTEYEELESYRVPPHLDPGASRRRACLLEALRINSRPDPTSDRQGACMHHSRLLVNQIDPYLLDNADESS